MINKKFFVALLASSLYLCANGNQQIQQSDLSVVESTLLPRALKYNSYEDMAAIAIYYYQYDKKTLEKSLKLLNKIAYSNNDTAAFIVSTYFIQNNMDIAYMFLKKYFFKQNSIFFYKKTTKKNQLLKEMFASIVLSRNHIDKKEFYKIIELLSVEDMPVDNLYISFLYIKLSENDIADLYLTKACNAATKGSKVYQYCTNSKDIIQN